MEGWVELSESKLLGKEGINEINRMFRELYDNMPGDGQSVRVYKGYGVPSLAAGVGSIYQRLDGGVNTTLYVYESGGWTAK